MFISKPKLNRLCPIFKKKFSVKIFSNYKIKTFKKSAKSFWYYFKMYEMHADIISNNGQRLFSKLLISINQSEFWDVLLKEYEIEGRYN